MRALFLTLALTACGQSTAPPATPDAEIATTSGMDLGGRIIAVGSDFRLDAMPDQNSVVLVFPDYDQTVSGPYVPPQATDTGAVMQTGGITMTLTPGVCTLDGVNYPMSAHIEVINARPADGCALVRWDHHLLDLIPQIDACIAQAPNGMNWVSYAGRTAPDEVTVRLQGNQPAMHCVVRGDAATLSPAQDDQRIAGDREALFVRGSGGPNPGGECYAAPEVRSASGEMLGWMMDPQGC